MVEDDVIREVREARETYARSHNFDVHAMVEDLRARDLASDRPVVRRAARRPEQIEEATAASFNGSIAESRANIGDNNDPCARAIPQ